MSERHGDLETLRRAFASLPAVPPAPETCPAPERLLAAVAGELPPAELRDIVEHVASCPACAEDWRLAAALERRPAIPEPRRIRRPSAWWTAAAAAVVLAGLGLLSRLHDGRSAAWRGVKAGPTLSSLETCPREGCVLRWSEVKGATYDLDVHVENGRRVDLATGLTGTQYQIPPAHLAGIPAATVLTWQVTANLPDGHRLSSSKGNFILH